MEIAMYIFMGKDSPKEPRASESLSMLSWKSMLSILLEDV